MAEKKKKIENKMLYRKNEDIMRKWISIYRKAYEHGDKGIYEDILTEAFNLTEFVMDNYIDEFQKKQPEKRKYGIDFSQTKFGFYGKVEILKQIGESLPNEIDEVRKKRNRYVHSTKTYKADSTPELDDFKIFHKYITTLGTTIGRIRKLPKNGMYPEYNDLKLQVGNTLGKRDEYVVLELVSENEKTRKFTGKNEREKVNITEIIPYGDSKKIYDQHRALKSVRKGGIIRVLDVVYENATCYIIQENIEGVPLMEYLQQKQLGLDVANDLYSQILRIYKGLDNQVMRSTFQPENFIVDKSNTLWLKDYTVWDETPAYEQIEQYYKGLFGIKEAEEVDKSEIISEEIKGVDEEVKSMSEELKAVREELKMFSEELKTPVEVKKAEDVLEIEAEVQEPEDVLEIEAEIQESEDTAVTDAKRLGTVIGVCSGILLILWVISLIAG